MQRDEPRPPAAGRPSLISDAPRPESSRNGILHGLDKGSRPTAAAPASERKRNVLVLAAATTVVVLVVAVAAMAWLDGAAGPEPVLAQTPPTPPAAAAPAAAPATPAAAPVAAIVEDSAAASPPLDHARSLKEMLNDNPAKTDHEELKAALERPHHAPLPAKPKLAGHKKVEQAARKPVQVVKKTEPPAKNQAARQDNDVKLLAALMAHVQRAQPGKAPSTPGYQLKQCRLMNEAGAEQCRDHLCATTAHDEPECKQRTKAAKGSGAS